MLATAGEQELWLERIRAGVRAALVFLDEDPLWARMFVLEAQLGGGLTEELVDRVCQALPEVLEESRRGLVVGTQLRPPARLIAELVVLGVLSILRTRILRQERGPLGDLERPLMLSVVEPYLARGAGEADRGGEPVRHGGLIVEQLPFRPHPRILLMLKTIASEPSMTSGQVAQALRSHGHRHDVSDLFKPLERRGVIEDVNAGKAVATTRAWVLTAYGCRVFEAMTGNPAHPGIESPVGTPSVRHANALPPGSASDLRRGDALSDEKCQANRRANPPFADKGASNRGPSLRERCAVARPAAPPSSKPNNRRSPTSK